LVLTNKRTASVFISVCVAVMLFAIRAEAAGALPSPTPNGCLPATTTANEMNRIVYQAFPAQGAPETGWIVVWSEFGTRGLWIEAAWFIPKQGASPISVLGPSGLSNIFVPYHNGVTRAYDLNPYTLLREAVPAYAGPCGSISGPSLQPSAWPNPPRPVMIKEIRDRGVAWTSDGHIRRGQELLLWSVSEAGNYEYIIQYGFRDDGTITFRLGSTGYNSPPKPYEAHMHNALWYIDINVGQSDHNSVSLMKHFEPPPSSTNTLQAADTMTPFNGGVEGFADWNAEEFTGLNVMNTQTTNARGHNISYDLMPMRTGTARHDELFTKHDFWVTKNPLTWTSEVSYDNVLSYLNGESITDTDVVLWYMSSNHHTPRDEDHEFDALGNQSPGVAQVMWSGFDLHPRNLFDDAPLHGCAAVPQGIVGWWPFEENPGVTTIQDIKNIGIPNNGTSHPGASGPIHVPGAVGGGVINGALSFDGVDDYVEVNDAFSLNFGVGDFSADYWLNVSPSVQSGVILDKRIEFLATTYQGYHLFVYDGKPGLQLANGTTFANYIANATIADGYWHHVAVTVNRTSSIKEIRWYVDGNLVDITPAPLAGSITSPAPLRFGARSFTTLSGFLKGSLGEFELFNRVLTPDEIGSIYAAGKCR
jgi:primary-amine oxidase